MFGHFSLFFRTLGAFWTQLEPSCDFFKFFGDYFRFFVDFGWILGWNFGVCSMIFGASRKNCEFVKHGKTLVFTVFCKSRPPEKQQKINKNSMKNLCKFRVEKNIPRDGLKNRCGRVLGSIWEGLGSLWAGFWPLLGAFCLPFGRSRPYLFQALLQNEL